MNNKKKRVKELKLKTESGEINEARTIERDLDATVKATKKQKHYGDQNAILKQSRKIKIAKRKQRNQEKYQASLLRAEKRREG